MLPASCEPFRLSHQNQFRTWPSPGASTEQLGWVSASLHQRCTRILPCQQAPWREVYILLCECRLSSARISPRQPGPPCLDCPTVGSAAQVQTKSCNHAKDRQAPRFGFIGDEMHILRPSRTKRNRQYWLSKRASVQNKGGEGGRAELAAKQRRRTTTSRSACGAHTNEIESIFEYLHTKFATTYLRCTKCETHGSQQFVIHCIVL